MPPKIHLSQRLMTDVFWKTVMAAGDERIEQRQALAARLNALEGLREQAAYDTGTVSFATAWSLYNLVRYFKPARVVEVGTFIGKSTIAMATALDDAGAPGHIDTCDLSNAITLPWAGTTSIRQFGMTSSVDMLKTLEGEHDLIFLDGRIGSLDLPEISRLSSDHTILALDDFEGVEKGVANLSKLATLPKFQRHFLVYPPSEATGVHYGLTSHSLVAVLLPLSTFVFSKQG